jgi:hypothetical protein
MGNKNIVVQIGFEPTSLRCSSKQKAASLLQQTTVLFRE